MSFNNPVGITIPYVLENGRRERVMDLWSRLHKERVVFLGEEINDHVANIICGQLLHLESESSSEPISFYINSPGGVVTSGMAIYDTMRYISSQVHTYCIGQAASMSAILLSAGEPGHRSILPNAEVMIHQPSGGTQGRITDMEINLERFARMKKRLTAIMVKHTGQDFDKCLKDMELDYWMTAEEAKEYGIVDEVITKSKREI